MTPLRWIVSGAAAAVIVAGAAVAVVRHQPLSGDDEKALLTFADAYMERRTAVLAEAPGTPVKVEPITVGGVTESSASLKQERADERGVADTRDVLATVDEDFSRPSTRVKLRHAGIDWHGRRYLDVDERGAIEDSGVMSEWISPRRFTFRHTSTGWELISQSMLDLHGKPFAPGEKVDGEVSALNEPSHLSKKAMMQGLHR